MNKKMMLYGGVGVFVGLLFFVMLETPLKDPSSGTYAALIISTILLCVFAPVLIEGLSDNESGNLFTLIALWAVVYLALFLKLKGGPQLTQTAAIAALFVILTFVSHQYSVYLKEKKLHIPWVEKVLKFFQQK